VQVIPVNDVNRLVATVSDVQTDPPSVVASMVPPPPMKQTLVDGQASALPPSSNDEDRTQVEPPSVVLRKTPYPSIV
jgi:hypothetical protein